MSGEQEEAIEILLVDDDPAILDLIETFLVRNDDRFEIRTTTSPREGLSLLRTDGIDGVVSDYDMAEMDGLAFLDAVRDEFPELPFVLFTGQGSEEIASRAISQGVTDYLQKSLGTDQYAVLANRITNAVERYRARQALEESQRRLSLLIDQSPFGVVEFTPDGRIVRLNGTAEELLGFCSNELAGESWTAIVPESDHDRVATVYDGIHDGDGGYHSVNRNVRKDGGLITCEWHNRFVTDETGEVVAIISQFQDVTERAARERELRELTQFRRAIIESANVWINVLDEEGNVAIWNRAAERISGYSRSAVIGHDAIWEWLYPDEEYRAEIVDYASDILQGEATAEEFETTIRTRDGEERALAWHSRAMVDDDDELIGSVAVARDVTDERGRKRRLERQNERLSAFAGIVSHDLRNPLTVASGHLELARQERDSDHLREVARVHDRMNRLVTNLLAIAWNGDVDDEPVDLAALVDRAWRTVDTGRATLVNGATATVRADEGQLRQLVENLVRNAVEHGSTGSQRGSRADDAVERGSTSYAELAFASRDADTGDGITITVGALDDGFYVEDDGAGVPENARERVFESGYSTSPEGTGYGLSIVKRIVEAHGWEIAVTESTSGGARFEITGMGIDPRSA